LDDDFHIDPVDRADEAIGSQRALREGVGRYLCSKTADLVRDGLGDGVDPVATAGQGKAPQKSKGVLVWVWAVVDRKLGVERAERRRAEPGAR
jgi:hypothetical protein